MPIQLGRQLKACNWTRFGCDVQSVRVRVADPKRRIVRNIWEGPLLWRWRWRWRILRVRWCCVLFAVVRPLGEEEGVWVKGRAEAALFGAGGNQRKQRMYGHGPQASSGSQAPSALRSSVQPFLPFLPLLALCTTIIGRSRLLPSKHSITKRRAGLG